jgi:stearoyl-CoA desaturase (delta-9 desaturase)
MSSSSGSVLTRVVAPELPPAGEIAESRIPDRRPNFVGRLVTALLVIGPGAAIGVVIPFLWGNVIHLHDVVIGAVLYAITGHGISIGYHRLFTHRSFKANRVLKIVLAAAGSMAMEGSVISWVAIHRRHHVRSDKVGDPHSPWLQGSVRFAQVRGFFHAHVGWLFSDGGTSETAYASDLLRDRDLVAISKLFPLFAVASLALPFAIGYLVTRSLTGALGVFLWAGLVRVVVLHHVTWSINSVCHMFGRSPFESGDRSTNYAPLAVLSFGESWHNYHHADPSSARHGAQRGQIDTSAGLIRTFERFGWATNVRWPDADRVASFVRPTTR